MKLQRTGTAADMVEMEMRFDDEIDARRVAPDRFEPRADLFARIKADPEQRGDPGAEAPLRIMRQSGWRPVSNKACPFWCSIRATGIGTLMPPSPPSIRWAKSPVTGPQVNA
jgi:hypothetical protein